MRDPRDARIARTIVRHSTQLKPGEVVLIESFDLAGGLLADLIDEAQAAGAIPLVHLRRYALIRQQLLYGSDRQIALQAEIEMFQMKKADAYVGIRAAENATELADVPPEHTALHARLLPRLRSRAGSPTTPLRSIRARRTAMSR